MRTTKGFTFLELMFASFILVGLILVFASVSLRTSQQGRQTGDDLQATLVAETMIDEQRAELHATGTPLPCTPQDGDPHHTTRTHMDVTYDIETSVTRLKMNDATGALEPQNCDAPGRTDAYRYALELSWSNDGQLETRTYTYTIHANQSHAPVLHDYQIDTEGDPNYTHLPAPGDDSVQRGEHEPGASLKWSIDLGAQPLDVRIPPTTGSTIANLPPAGKVTANPSESTHFPLVIQNPAGSIPNPLADNPDARAADVPNLVTIYVDDNTITSFDASLPIVGPEEPVQLTWSTSAPCDLPFEEFVLDHPTNHPLDCTNNVLLDGEDEYITETTEFRLTLQDKSPIQQPLDTATTTVTYSDTPIIDSFTITPLPQCSVPGGNTIRLEWVVYAASNVTLDGVSVPVRGSKVLSVTETTDFTLEATNNHGTTSAPEVRTATIYRTPELDISASPNPVLEATPTTVTWDVEHATQTLLDGEVVPHQGSRDDILYDATTYELRGSNEGLCDDVTTYTAHVNRLEITEASLDSPLITEGDSTTLSWDTNYDLDPTYHQLKLIDPEAGTSLDITENNPVTIAPPATTTLELQLTNTDPENPVTLDTRTVDVRVVPPPEINSFTTTTPAMCGQERISFSWNTSHATRVLLDGSNVSPDGTAERVAYPGSVYTLLAENEAGTTVTKDLEIDKADDPVIAASANPNPTINGYPSTLYWNVTGADSLTINGMSRLLNDEMTVDPADDTTTNYEFVATKGYGPYACTTTVEIPVKSESIHVSDFGLLNGHVTLGDEAHLEWTVAPFHDEEAYRIVITENQNGKGGAKVIEDVTHQGAFGSIDIPSPRKAENYVYEIVITDLRTGEVVFRQGTSVNWVEPPNARDVRVSPNPRCGPGNVDVTYRFDYGDAAVFGLDDMKAISIDGSHRQSGNRGTVSLYVSKSQTVTLEAQNNAHDTDSTSTYASVVSDTSVDAFDSNYTTIDPGQSVTLAWSTSGATHVVLNGQTLPANGSVTRNPGDDITYTLTSYGACGEDSRQIDVDVRDARIGNLEASPSIVQQGDEVTLSWDADVDSAYSLHLVGHGDVTGQNSITTTVDGTTTFILQIRNGDEVLREHDATVIVPPSPEVTTFTSSPPGMCGGGNYELTWNVEGSVMTRLDGWPVPHQGSINLHSRTNRTHTLTATNSAGETTTRTYMFHTGMPIISTFEALGHPVAGEPYTLTWDTTSGITILLDGEPVSAIGSVERTQPEAGIVTHTLSVEDAGGCITRQDLTLDLDEPIRARADQYDLRLEQGVPVLYFTYTVSGDPINIQAAEDAETRDWYLNTTFVRPEGTHSPTNYNLNTYRSRSATNRQGATLHSASVMWFLYNDANVTMLYDFDTEVDWGQSSGKQIQSDHLSCSLRVHQGDRLDTGEPYTLLGSAVSRTFKRLANQQGYDYRVIRTGDSDGVYEGNVAQNLNASLRLDVREPGSDGTYETWCHQTITNGEWNEEVTHSGGCHFGSCTGGGGNGNGRGNGKN